MKETEYRRQEAKEGDWTLVISSQHRWWNFRLREIWRYRDLLILFVRRDFVSVYKQTILGPLWYILQPLLTTFTFTIIFNRVANIPTDGIPPTLFYLSGLVIWNYFSICLTNTANTFTANAGLFGKVYFPRIIVPLSSVVSALIRFAVQFVILIAIILFYYFFTSADISFQPTMLLIPFLLIIIAVMSLGLGIIVSSLTTKYRDLSFLITFGIQLLMYATPVIYPLSFAEEEYQKILQWNPITPIVEIFRYSLLGRGDFNQFQVVYTVLFTLVILTLGLIVFNRVEKSFMDVV